MPHGRDGGDDFASTDEVKVYKEEGDEENKSSAENLSEVKRGLLTETEQGKDLLHSSVGSCCSISDSQFGFGGCLADYYSFHGRLPLGYPPLLSSYPYDAGSAIHGLNNVPILPPRTWFYMYNNSSGPQPYMGLPPPPPPPPPPSLHIGPHTGYSPGSSMYHLSGASPSQQLSHLFVSNDFSPISCFDRLSWSNPSFYPNPFGSSYLPSVMSGSSLSQLNPGSVFSSRPPQPHKHHHRHSPAVASASSSSCLKLPYPGISCPVLVSTAKEDDHQSRQSVSVASGQKVWFPLSRSSESSNCKWPTSVKPVSSNRPSSSQHSHVKKPLNAFMLFMKEMRSKVIDECTLKESAAINQILGRKWHSLEQSEQNKYYEMARKEKLRHRQMFPGWSARDNYSQQARKKRKQEHSNQFNHRPALREVERVDRSILKKCRARYGLDQQHRWCKPCRRKKRCIKFLENDDNEAGGVQEISSSSSSQVAPAADSTVNEFQLLSSSKTPSTSENDCLASESEAPTSCQSIPVGDRSHDVCDRQLSCNCQFYPNSKSFVSSWSDGACSSTRSPRLPFLSRVKPLGSNKHISSTAHLSNSS